MSTTTPSAAEPATTDEAFWRAAYQAHGSAVLGYLRRRVGADAEDLLQEVFIRAIRAGTFRPGATLRSYLHSIAHNLVIDHCRRPRLVLVDGPEDEQAPFDDLPDGRHSPEERVQWTDFGRAFTRVLNGLAESHRKAFSHAVLQDRSYAEIARIEGWSLSQVKVNVHRARRKLIDALGDRIPSLSVARLDDAGHEGVR